MLNNRVRCLAETCAVVRRSAGIYNLSTGQPASRITPYVWLRRPEEMMDRFAESEFECPLVRRVVENGAPAICIPALARDCRDVPGI